MKSNQKLSILHLISSTDFLGAERVVCELASHADPESVLVQVGILGSPHAVVDAFKTALQGVATSLFYFPCKGKISFEAIKALRLHLRTHRTDLIHSHGYKTNMYALLAAKSSQSGTGVIATNHTWKTRSVSEQLYKSIDSRILRLFPSVIAVSTEVRDEMIRLGIEERRVHVVYNGVPVTDVSAENRFAGRKEFGFSEDALVVGCVASLTEEKAHKDLITAFAHLHQKVPRARLLLVGDGPLRQRLAALALSLGVSDLITFAGQRRDAKQLYAAFDIFALVSYAEGLPMALLEAMATSLPVVVSAVGAIPQVITDRSCGYLVNPGAVDEIVDAFFALCQDASYRLSIGECARKEVLANYSVGRMCTDYENLYREAIRRNL